MVQVIRGEGVMTGLSDLRMMLKRKASKKQAQVYQSFFKTGPGQYGEGDVFIGVKVPVLRTLAREHCALELGDVATLLGSEIHEERMLALLIMMLQYQQGDAQTRAAIYKLFVTQMKQVNNWDLVDTSAPTIVGGHLEQRSRKPLYAWARARDLWRRRVAIVATYHFIRQGEFDDTLKIAALLLCDEHDLIHKAVGWMLREVGGRDQTVEERFLKKHYPTMPRTMLRYAIEKFPERRRKAYLRGTI